MTADCVGGVWSYATTLCRALARHEVEVLLAVTGGAMSASQRAEAKPLANVEVRQRPCKCEWMDQPWRDVEAAGNWLCELADEWACDVVHLNDYAHGGRGFKAPRIVVAHSDVFSWYRHVRGERPPAAFDRYREQVTQGLLAADAVVAPTAAVLDDLRNTCLDPGGMGETRVIPNAVASADEVAQEREPFILCAGRLWDEAKNVRTLATAAAGMEWPVVVAGEADHPDGGTCFFENVELLGPLSQDKLFERMAQAAIYALPARYEPFGLSAAEAAMRGCALVLGDIASLREVWEEAALFVPPDDPSALRGALKQLIGDESLRETYVRAARRRVCEFSPERQALAYLELYQRHAVPRLIGVPS